MGPDNPRWRDPRWADMHASVREETFGTKTVITFEISIVYKNERLSTRYAADPAEFRYVKFNLYGYILDGMVVEMDKYLATKD